MTQDSQQASASIVKIDDEKKLVFGWASIIKDENGMILLDRQDDFIDSEDELEKAAYDYVLHSRDGGEMHVRRGVAKMVESVVFTEEKQRALGIPVGSMPTGWWIGFKVDDERVWEQVKKGEYAGFSVHGTGKRESTELPVSKITEIGKADAKKKKNKIGTVMSEFKAGKLKSSSGEPVTDPKQAMAIAISEQKRAKMKKVSISEIVAKTEELTKGDRPGHPFRGNQWTKGGAGGASPKGKSPSAKKKAPSAKKPASGAKAKPKPKAKEKATTAPASSFKVGDSVEWTRKDHNGNKVRARGKIVGVGADGRVKVKGNGRFGETKTMSGNKLSADTGPDPRRSRGAGWAAKTRRERRNAGPDSPINYGSNVGTVGSYY